MVCSVCGAWIDNVSQPFCDSCGASLDSAGDGAPGDPVR
jgi:predicted amidophosphoribosyltransferase